MATNKYIKTEKDISKATGIKIDHAIRLFDLNKFDLDKNAIIALFSASVPDLEWDWYDVRKAKFSFLLDCNPSKRKELTKLFKFYYSSGEVSPELSFFIQNLNPQEKHFFDHIEPYRRRSVSQFILTKIGDDWIINKENTNSLIQNVSDYRSLERKYKETSNKIINNHHFISLLKVIANITFDVDPKAIKQRINVHEMAIIAKDAKPGDNSPEGIHQDGSDYVVTALVIERKGINGGVSKIYGSDKSTNYFSYELQVGEGIFQADKNTNLYHAVTPIYLDKRSSTSIGERNIIGFDIDIID